MNTPSSKTSALPAILAAAGLLLLLTALGCVAHQSVQPSDDGILPTTGPEMADSRIAPPARPASTGSLWPSDEQGYLFSDHKARKTGDLLTVKIVESAQASKAADTKLSRDNSMNASLENLFGIEKSVVASNPFVNTSSLLKGEFQNKFEGDGSTTRSDDLTTQMTVVVQRVLPNGNLMVAGSRVVGLNYEQQMLTLTGIVRPEDVDSQNTVLSTYIANADIRYGGNGVVTDKQHPGWLTWLTDWIWPL